MAFFEIFERIVAAYASGDFQREAEAARRRFFDRTGRVSDDDLRFEERINAFLEWYALARPLDGLGVTPAVATLGELSEGPERRAVRALATSHWSLFRIDATSEESMHLFDLWSGARFLAHEKRRTGLVKGDLIEARLFWDGERVVFTRAFCYHPKDARRAILARIRLSLHHRQDKEAVLFGLARARLRAERYGKNVPLGRIYETIEVF